MAFLFFTCSLYILQNQVEEADDSSDENGTAPRIMAAMLDSRDASSSTAIGYVSSYVIRYVITTYFSMNLT